MLNLRAGDSAAAPVDGDDDDDGGPVAAAGDDLGAPKNDVMLPFTLGFLLAFESPAWRAPSFLRLLDIVLRGVVGLTTTAAATIVVRQCPSPESLMGLTPGASPRQSLGRVARVDAE